MANNHQTHHPHKNDKLNIHFAAFGTWPEGSGQVTGKLTGDNGTIRYGCCLAEAPYWVLFFRNLPENETFELKLTGEDGHEEPIEGLTFSNKYLITIKYPKDKSLNYCGSNFVSYGTSDSTVSVSGTLGANNGTTLQQPTPPYFTWSVQWTELTTSDTYDLKITQGATTQPFDGVMIDGTC